MADPDRGSAALSKEKGLVAKQLPHLAHQGQTNYLQELALAEGPQLPLLPARRPLHQAVQDLGAFRAQPAPRPEGQCREAPPRGLTRNIIFSVFPGLSSTKKSSPLIPGDSALL